MNTRTRIITSIAIPVLLIIIVVGAFLWQQRAAGSTATTTPSAGAGTQQFHCAVPGGAAPQKLTTMTLALDWTPNTNHTGIYVALAQGWYRAEGIEMKLMRYYANVWTDGRVSTGKGDVGVSSTEVIVADAAVGQPVVSIAAIIQHNTSALVTLASSGLTRPSDLDGKTYGGFGAPYESA